MMAIRASWALCLLLFLAGFSLLRLPCQNIGRIQPRAHIKANEEPTETKGGSKADARALPLRDVIVYLSQGRAEAREALSERFDAIGPSARLLYHSFDEDCEGCLFQEGTTLARGRNLVLRDALADPLIVDRAKYFVFFDDDVILSCSGRNDGGDSAMLLPEEGQGVDCWRTYHEMLLNASLTHPFVKPNEPSHANYGGNPELRRWHERRNPIYESCTDDNFWSIRHDHVDFLYPFSTLHDKARALNCKARHHLVERCYPNAWLVDGRWTVHNSKHRQQEKTAGSIKRRRKWGNEILNKDYPELGPWDVGMMLVPGCNVSPDPPDGPVDPSCRKVTKARFQKWIEGEYEP